MMRQQILYNNRSQRPNSSDQESSAGPVQSEATPSDENLKTISHSTFTAYIVKGLYPAGASEHFKRGMNSHQIRIKDRLRQRLYEQIQSGGFTKDVGGTVVFDPPVEYCLLPPNIEAPYGYRGTEQYLCLGTIAAFTEDVVNRVHSALDPDLQAQSNNSRLFIQETFDHIITHVPLEGNIPEYVFSGYDLFASSKKPLIILMEDDTNYPECMVNKNRFRYSKATTYAITTETLRQSFGFIDDYKEKAIDMLPTIAAIVKRLVLNERAGIAGIIPIANFDVGASTKIEKAQAKLSFVKLLMDLCGMFISFETSAGIINNPNITFYDEREVTEASISQIHADTIATVYQPIDFSNPYRIEDLKPVTREICNLLIEQISSTNKNPPEKFFQTIQSDIKKILAMYIE